MAATLWMVIQSATLLHDLRQTEIEQETMFLTIVARICLNRVSSGPQSNFVVVNALPKFEASISRLNLAIPSCVALSKPCKAARSFNVESTSSFLYVARARCPRLCCLSSSFLCQDLESHIRSTFSLYWLPCGGFHFRCCTRSRIFPNLSV